MKMGAREVKASGSKPSVKTKIVKTKNTAASGKAKPKAKRTVN